MTPIPFGPVRRVLRIACVPVLLALILSSGCQAPGSPRPQEPVDAPQTTGPVAEPQTPVVASGTDEGSDAASVRRVRWGVEDLEVKDGLIYAKGESAPYTGITFDTFKDGTVRSEFHYVDGKKNGLGVIYYPSGRKAHEAISVNGVVAGTETEWWENGNKRKETVWHEGPNRPRTVTQWHENGKLFQTFSMEDAGAK